ncbi:WD40 repeat-like protein [Thelephora ganbajun]|uniref:WD40 repeat-like protein n=1 Tax=Thelephora ganbajun TaxID=370292 RepID=A0ACB6ZCX5_THEGA|nr:WD40 repeat-like protein [Thelephora ganbajun]
MSVDQIPVKVHRCRFVSYLPAAITALAFPPLPLPSPKGKTRATSPLKFPHLAIGRANGNIELAEWSNDNPTDQAPQAWVVSKTLPGPYPSKVDTLTFTLRHSESLSPGDVPTLNDLRLFSTGGGSELLEWDLARGCVRRSINSNGGAVWSVSANPKSTIIALGCEDGSIQLLSTENDELSHLRKLGKVKSRLLSIAWGPPVLRNTHRSAETTPKSDGSSDDENDDWSDGWLVTGCADSSIRQWDFSTGRVTNRLTTDKTRGERTLVWSVCVLGDGTIVSGDSMGIVKFWDSRTCTQLSTFQAHGADVLCLCTSPEGNTVYSSGVDQKIVQFTNVGGPASPSKSRWIQASSRRMHSHDVRSLAIWPPFTPLPPSHQHKFPVNLAPILVSGGLDMSVVLTPAAIPSSTTVSKVTNPLSTSVVATFEDSYHRKMGYSTGFSGTGRVKVARKKRLVLSAQDQSINLWRIFDRDTRHADAQSPTEGEAGLEGWQKILEMDLIAQSNIVSCDVSDDGRWIAVSDWYEVKLFRLTFTPSEDMNVTRVKDFGAVLKDSTPGGSSSSVGATVLSFTPDSQKLVVCTSESSFVAIFHLPQDDTSLPRPLRIFDHHRLRNVSPNKSSNTGGATDTGGRDVDMNDLSDEDIPASKQLSVIPTITRAAISQDCQWFVDSDEMKRVYVYNLDSLQYHCVLPTFPYPIQALSFDPSDHSTLVIGLANNTIHIFNVESRTFPDWSLPLCSNLPKRFTHLHDPILGLTFDPVPSKDGSRKALFWGFTWICSVKLDSPAGWGGFSKKRRREHKTTPNGMSQPHADVGKVQVDVPAEDTYSQTQQKNFTVLTHYRPLLFVDFLDRGEMIVVERPLVDIMSTMPPAFFKQKYGSS